jgi:hypothetical protein
MEQFQARGIRIISRREGTVPSTRDKDYFQARRIIARHKGLLPDKKDHFQVRGIIARKDGLLRGTKNYCQALWIIARHERLLQGTEIAANHEGL